MNKPSVCKNCDKRVLHCHSVCSDYKAEKIVTENNRLANFKEKQDLSIYYSSVNKKIL